MIEIRVSLHGDVHKYRRGRPDPIVERLADDATIQSLVDAIGIDPAVPISFGINGQLARRDSPLHNGDEVLILTPMEGGR